MRAFYSDHFVIPLPEGHRFPMEKYARLRERVAQAGEDEFVVPDAATAQELLRAHDPGYVGRVLGGALTREEIRRIGFPWSPALAERARRSVGGTLGASRSALEDGVSANLAGGTHHAFPDRGEGYCVFNDVAVAARAMQAEGRARRVAVLDLDVHQGNGTAAIFRGDDSVFTLSVHGANNFPFRKEKGDLDIELPDRSGDDLFLAAVTQGVRVALAHGPDLAYYLAGADPFEGDRLGRLAVTKQALARRDELVLDLCGAAGVPVAVVMSGGYARDVDDTVDIHFQTIRAASARSGARTRRGAGPSPNPSVEFA
ncbi:MAG TPA: histone deacetylase [Longimicrobiales bacterium]|nr:histone deacetylase [Longimicrobiales bacterium]